MSYEVEWLLLSFAIMAVATLVNLWEKVERLDERFEGPLDGSVRADSAEPGGYRNRV